MVNKRGEFSLIAKKFQKIGKGNARISQSALILMQPINPNSNVYNFPVTINDGPIVVPNEEIRLDINDEFTVLEQGFFYRAVVTNPEAPEEFATVYLTSAPYELNQSYIAYQKLYTGRFNIAVNNIVYMQNWDLRQHEYKPITQLSPLIAGQSNATAYANNFKENSMVDVLPTITLSGAKKNQLQLTLPDAIAPIPSAIPFITTQNGENLSIAITHIVYFGRGFLAQNASNFQ